jgi:AraC-like DNA-binding protein
MVPLYFKVPRQKEESVRVESWSLPRFFDPIHFHEECQLTYILESEGMLFIGNQVDRFGKNELYLIGKNLPHVFRNDSRYTQNNSRLKARAISVFFSAETIEQLIKEIPESLHLIKLIESSSVGLRVSSESASQIKRSMIRLAESQGFERVLLLFSILNAIALSNSTELLSTKTHLPLEQEDRNRLNKVYEFTMIHYKERISLEQVAALINYSPTSFCRFFKQRTLKTFSQFLIELRISKACRLLDEGLANVSEACYSSGYNNISNFHRHFRLQTGMTPHMYKKRVNVS